MRKIIFTIIFTLVAFFNIAGQDNQVQTLIREGIELHDSAQYVQAVEKFESALQINPKSNLAMYELALSYLELKNFDKTLEYSTKVINSGDNNLLVGAYSVKSQALTESGKIDTAIELLKEGLEKNGDSYLLHFNLALDYYKKNDPEKSLEHVTRAIQLDKTFSGAFLLNAYLQRDKGMWVRSVFSFQMFLLLEPDSRRSHNAFSEMLQAMFIKSTEEEPVGRSFVQMQLDKNGATDSNTKTPSMTNQELNRKDIYEAIEETLESLEIEDETDTFEVFMLINETIINSLSAADASNEKDSDDGFWAFYYPFFKSINNSKYYEAFCRYISVSYYPESLQWWEENNDEAKSFVNWFEKGE